MSRLSPVLLSYAVIAVLTISGCAGPQGDPPGPASSVAASAPTGEPSGEDPAAEDPPGMIACGKATRAVSDGTLMNPGVITDITHASGTADAPVADAAQHLSAAYTEAVGAHGTDAEPDAVAAVSEAGA